MIKILLFVLVLMVGGTVTARKSKLRLSVTSPAFPFSPTQSGCKTEYGDLLFPGQTKMYGGGGSCVMCTCHHWGPGGLECLHGDCFPPMCVDYTLGTGACCYHCPNGRNCRIPRTGQLISAGQWVWIPGYACRCPKQSDRLPGDPRPEDTVALCEPVATSTSPRDETTLVVASSPTPRDETTLVVDTFTTLMDDDTTTTPLF